MEQQNPNDDGWEEWAKTNGVQTIFKPGEFTPDAKKILREAKLDFKDEQKINECKKTLEYCNHYMHKGDFSVDDIFEPMHRDAILEIKQIKYNRMTEEERDREDSERSDRLQEAYFDKCFPDC